MASLGQIVLGLASLAYGAHHLRNGVQQLKGSSGSLSKAPFHDSGRVQTANGPMRMRSYHIRNLDERIKHLRDRVDQGKRDPQVYAFARQAVSQRCGADWCIKEKDSLREAQAIFDAIRRRVRYTSDIHGVDTYQSPSKTLSLGTADCLPEGTLLLKADGSFAAIEDVRVGDTIFNGSGWTKVTNWWDKGVQETRALKLNNGANLVCTDEHRLFVVPRSGRFSDAEEVAAKSVGLGDDLLQPRELAFAEAQTLSRDEAFLLGTRAAESDTPLPHVSWDASTASSILEGLSVDDRTDLFSTTSPVLALQYRVLQRIQGRSTSIEHGGLGPYPVYRVIVRIDDARRPWAKVKGIFDAGERHVYDIETDSGRFYLAESDVVVHNCDDYSTLVCSALLSVGIPCRFKVIRTKGGSDWNHIYAQAGIPRAKPQKWFSMDASVPVPFGWEAPPGMVAASRVFPVR